MVLLFVASLVIYGSISYLKRQYPSWQNLQSVLGVSYNVANGLVALSITAVVSELFLTNKLLVKVGEYIADRVQVIHLPDSFRAEILGIIKTNLLREDYVREFRINSAPNEKVTIHSVFSFKVRNYGESPEKYSPKLEEQEIFQPRLIRIE